MNSMTAHFVGWDSVPTLPRRMSGRSPKLLFRLSRYVKPLSAGLLCLLLAGRTCAIQAAEPSAEAVGMSLEEGRKFWSFQPVKDPPVPKVKNATWPRNAVDHFILARLEDGRRDSGSAADKRTLLRRVTFDLTGLPPTPAEMDAFLADTSPQAFEKVVDRLLASPRYGERWGRHWLDVVRYADTCGNASDYPVPQAHRYRDWVIRAFNRDLPYDQFLREQIAGDLTARRNGRRAVRAHHRHRLSRHRPAIRRRPDGRASSHDRGHDRQPGPQRFWARASRALAATTTSSIRSR